MVCISGLERTLGQAHVGLGRVVIFCSDGRLVDNRFLEAIALHRIFSWFSAVACFRRHNLFVQNGFVMPVNIYIILLDLQNRYKSAQ